MLTLLQTGLTGLDLIETGLAQRAARYADSGDDAAVLAHLATLPGAPGNAGAALGYPGQLAWNEMIGTPVGFHQASQASLDGRHQLYRATTPEPACVAMLVRLGKVLAAADQSQLLVRTAPSTPAWLQYLLNDALGGTFDWERRTSGPEDRSAWNVTLVAALLADDGQPEALLLPIVFERRELHPYQADMVLRQLLAPGALDDYLLAHVAEVAALAPVLPVAGRVMLVKRLGSHPTLLAPFAELLLQLALDSSKVVRTAAAQMLDAIDRDRLGPLLATMLRSSRSAEVGHAADLLARLHGDAARAALEAALADTTGKAAAQAIRAALGRLTPAATTQPPELPAPPPLPPAPQEVLADDAVELLQANHAALLAQARLDAAEEIEKNRDREYQSDYSQRALALYSTVTGEHLRQAVQALNGQAPLAALATPAVDTVLDYQGLLAARADFGLAQLLRRLTATRREGGSIWRHPLFRAWFAQQDQHQVDLRQLVAIIDASGANGLHLPLTCLYWNDEQSPQQMLPADRVWPVFAERTELIDIGLGLAPPLDPATYFYTPSVVNTLSVLATFPVMPARWLPRLLELALGTGKTDRTAIQQALARVPDIVARGSEALGSSQQEVRIEAARWLGTLGDRAALPALQAALNKEIREAASAAMLGALEALGEDIATHLSPDKLLAQARKGLKARLPAGLAWLDLDALPPCTWRDGKPVAAEIIRWWVVFACKLKEPAGNPLLERYLSLLAPEARATLGRWLLHRFIGHDTRGPSLEEAMAWADANLRRTLALYQSAHHHMGMEMPTTEQLYEDLKREHLASYIGTAISEKGMLALTSGVPGREFTAIISDYMRVHYLRRAQVEALLASASNIDDTAVIQLMLAVARRHRTTSVQEKARTLVQRIADRNGWTRDQLADRTVPTGGLDDSGTLALSFGSRQFTVTLDADLKPVLRNADGKVIAALPEPRQDDDADAAKEAKQLLGACKKEVKQVVTLQTGRLYEAMCTGRVWPAADWRTYLQQHALVGRLAQRLVWQQVPSDTAPARTFRPTEDGSLIDVDDNDFALAEGAGVRLAHRVLLDAPDAAAWAAHLKDYKVTPLFAQLAHALPVAAVPEGSVIDDRLGWLADSYKLRSAFTKRGYRNAPPEHGPVFYEYYKEFESAGLYVGIQISGSALSGENDPAALKTLGVRKLGQHRYGGGEIPLRQLPPALLAEVWADYHAVAAACAGFDPDWQKKVRWE